MIRINQANLFPLNFDGYVNATANRWRQHLQHAVQALGAGASTVPFGDNGDVFRALAESRSTSAEGRKH